MSVNQYLGKDKLIGEIGVTNFNKDDLISADSYDENNVLTKFMKIDEKNRRNLIRAAIHISLIGSGQKTYGSIRDDNGNVLSIIELFDNNKILYNKSQNERYADDTLSARRLVRLLRYQIQNFIVVNNRPSYLWLKYSNDRDVTKINICFPGAEHLIDNVNDAHYLIDTYKNVDSKFGTSFCTRIRRVLIARGVIKFEEIINV
jgi:hypothetical protein